MIKYLTEKEEKQFIEAIQGKYNKRDKAIIKLAANTGLRVSELCSLNLSDVKNGRIKEELLVRKEITKGKSERLIPLNDKAKKAIEELLTWNQDQNFKQDPDNFLLISQKGNKFTRQHIQRIVKKAREKANLDIKATPHSLRHTFATRVLDKTDNLRIVQKLLGHKSIATTQIYADVSREKLRYAVSLL